jgi:hypothetical protein
MHKQRIQSSEKRSIFGPKKTNRFSVGVERGVERAIRLHLRRVLCDARCFRGCGGRSPGRSCGKRRRELRLLRRVPVCHQQTFMGMLDSHVRSFCAIRMSANGISARGVRKDAQRRARRRSQQPLARSVHGAFFSLFFVKFNTENVSSLWGCFSFMIYTLLCDCGSKRKNFSINFL